MDLIALWGIFALLGIPTGVILTRLAWKKTSGMWRPVLVSFVLALFFSVSFEIGGRFPAPLPTLVAIGFWMHQQLTTYDLPKCIPSSEGCEPVQQNEYDFLGPMSTQWLGWFLIVCLACMIYAMHTRRKLKKPEKAQE